MKQNRKRWLGFLMSGAMMLTMLPVNLTAYGDPGDPGEIINGPEAGHQHVFSNEMSYDEDGHFHQCICGEKEYYEDHTVSVWEPLDEALEIGICDVCGMSVTRNRLEIFFGIEASGEEDDEGRQITYTGEYSSLFIEVEGGAGYGFEYEFQMLEDGEWGPVPEAFIISDVVEIGEEIPGQINQEIEEESRPYLDLMINTPGIYTFRGIVTDAEGNTAVSEPESLVVECVHSFNNEPDKDENYHWWNCDKCGEKVDKSGHCYNPWELIKNDEGEEYLWRSCSACGFEQTADAKFTATLTVNWTEGPVTVDYGNVIMFQIDAICGVGDYRYSYQICKDGVWETIPDWDYSAIERPIQVTGEVAYRAVVMDSEDNEAVSNVVYVTVEHEHEYSDDWYHDEKNHWHQCECGEKADEAAHDFTEWETSAVGVYGEYFRSCNTCGYGEVKRELQAELSIVCRYPAPEAGDLVSLEALGRDGYGDYTYTFMISNENEWEEIRAAGTDPIFETRVPEGYHSYAVIVTDEDGDTAWAYDYINAGQHTEHVFNDEEWDYDEEGHFHICRCGEIKDKQAHEFSAWSGSDDSDEIECRVCEVCGYIEEREAVREGWIETDAGMKYRNADGSYVVNKWKKIDGKWYHFDADGIMQTGWYKEGSTYYYLKEDGTMAADEWVENDKYYLDANGKWVKGKVKDGSGEAGQKGEWKKDAKGYWYRNPDGTYPKNQWKQINGKWYHFDANGYMQTGWYQENGVYYYLKADGSMAADEWVENDKYYLDANGKWVKGKVKDGSGEAGQKGEWKKDAKGYWYRNPDGTYPKNQWKKIDGKWYHFDASGYMQTGWLKDGNYWYYLKPSGQMAADEWVGNGKYYIDANGHWVEDAVAQES